MTLGVNLIGLGLLDWGLSYQLDPPATGAGLAGLVLVVAANAGWLVWLRCRDRPGAGTVNVAATMVMALAGGALATFGSAAVTFPAMAALALTSTWPLGRVAPALARSPCWAPRWGPATPSRW